MKGKAISITSDASDSYAHINIACGYRDGESFYYEMDPAAVNRTYWNLSCQIGSTGDQRTDPYAIEWAVGGPHHYSGTISVKDIPAIMRSRAKLMRALDKGNATYGYPVTFRDHAARLYAAYRPVWLFNGNWGHWVALGPDAGDADRFLYTVDGAVRDRVTALYGETAAA